MATIAPQWTDFYAGWLSARDPEVIHDDEALLQAISAMIPMNINEIYFGDGSEVALPQSLFEFVDEVSSSILLQEIAKRIRALDQRITVNVANSSISSVGSEVKLNLSIGINGKVRKLSRQISV